ncbi:MAG: lipoyl(octanoyl) transferase LipB [Bacteroidota bacterium]
MPDADRQRADALLLGRVPYRHAWDLQARIQRQLIDAKRADPPQPADHVVLVVEHPPVYTIGKSGDPANLLASAGDLARLGAESIDVDRGGDITFHGPGQVVVYPILDLDRLATPAGEPLRDLHRYLRELEESVIRTCAAWGVTADRVSGRTGVWVGPDNRGDERKVCAMGVRCSRWVTMHGLALNVSTDLGWFDHIIPCGIDDRGVTTLERESEEPVSFDSVVDVLLGHLAERLGLALRIHRDEPARDRLGVLVPEILSTRAT